MRPGARVDVQVVGPDDWALWRELRLEALQDTPIGFGETYAAALPRTEASWREAMARPGVKLVAHDAAGPAGMAGGFVDPTGRTTVYAVFVRPRARGQGVLDALVGELTAWAAPLPLRLEVHEDNGPAAAAYARLGFVATGSTRAYDLDRTRELHELSR